MRNWREKPATAGGRLVVAVSLLLVALAAYAPPAAASDEPDGELDFETAPTTTAPPETLPALPEGEVVEPPAAAPAEVPEDAEVPGDPDSLLDLARRDPRALGSLSLGSPDAGLVLNPVPMPEGDLWTVRNPAEAYGTSETVGFVVAAVSAVEARHPGSPRLVVGDISRSDGGRLNRHRSHQAGRDVDLGFYYLRGERQGFSSPRKGELDLPRTWALVRALVTETDVERIFLDRSVQNLLHAHALAEGEDREWLDDVFGRRGTAGHKGIVQHVRRHRDHLHVRFYNPVAQERARVAYPALVEAGLVPPPTVRHFVRRGETLGHLASRYGTLVSAIRAANGLRSSSLRAGRRYLIPIRRLPPDTGPVVVPGRRLPPAPPEAADPASAASLETPALAP